MAIAQWFACPLQAVLIRAACSIAARPRSLGSPGGKRLGVLRRAIQYHVIALSIVTHISTDHMHNTARSEASFAEGCTYRRPSFNCVVKQLCFWLFKVDCEFKDCDLRVLHIGHTCVTYTLRSNNCELREKSQRKLFGQSARKLLCSKTINNSSRAWLHSCRPTITTLCYLPCSSVAVAGFAEQEMQEKQR